MCAVTAQLYKELIASMPDIRAFGVRFRMSSLCLFQAKKSGPNHKEKGRNAEEVGFKLSRKSFRRERPACCYRLALRALARRF